MPILSIQNRLFQSERAKVLFDYLFVMVQTAILFYVFIAFNLERESQLNKVLPIIWLGLGIHYWLPKQYKMPFFVLLSFASIFFLAGLINASVLIAIGLFLILLCHLPIKYNYRLLLISATVLGLIMVCIDKVYVYPVSGITTLIGTMFLMRLFIYVYELKYNNSFDNIWQRVAYFFLLPNVCFPLFPLVDFKAFVKTYYNTKTSELHALAVRRIFRGIIHLITYRIIYFFILPEPTEIHDLYSIIEFAVFSYMLILRLSGIFHLSLGILGLFGFNLPEIFNNYFFASSFNDLWRRVNLYWREALMKVVYYPMYFKFKKLNKRTSVAISVLIVFVFNWALHGYQWLWIRGSFYLAPNDILFWSVFGIAVMINSVYLQKEHQAKKINPNTSEPFKVVFLKLLKPFLMFSFMVFIWMMWSSTSIAEWLYLLSFFSGTTSEWLNVLLGFTALFCLANYLYYSYKSGLLGRIIGFYKKHITPITALLTGLLLLVSFPSITSFIRIQDQPVVMLLQESEVNLRDKKIMERGYYQELLTDANNPLNTLNARMKGPKNWNKNKAYIKTNNILQKEFKANTEVIFKLKHLSTNQHGMRDKDYMLQKPEDTYRIALLGGSYEMGAGVGDNENYESVAEDLLNNRYDRKFEILNFAVGGYHLIENVYNTKFNVLRFKPDALIYTAHSNEFYRMKSRLIDLFTSKVEIEDPFLRKIKSKSGIKSRMCRLEKDNRLKPYIKSIIEWGYNTIANDCKTNGIKPIWVYVPALGDGDYDPDFDVVSSIAKEAGFEIIILKDLFKDHNFKNLIVAPWDYHPNSNGHRIIGNKLFKEIVARQKELKLVAWKKKKK